MTLTMERPNAQRTQSSKRRDPLESIPLTPTLKKLLAEQEANPKRKTSRAEWIEALRWLKADLDDAMRANGFRKPL